MIKRERMRRILLFVHAFQMMEREGGNMNGCILFIPFLCVHFGLLSKLNNTGIKRAAHVPSMYGMEQFAYWLYQISNAAIILYLCFLSVEIRHSWVLYIGLIIYILGLVLCTITIYHFAFPSTLGFNNNGLFRYSRNLMYVAYFDFFMRCSLLTSSWLLGGITILFQISAYWIILSKERWCIAQF